MELIIKRGNLVLAEGAAWADGRLIGELPFSHEREMEVLPLLGAAGVSVFDRTTRSVSLEFKIAREHASQSAALVFCATHDEVATGKASLILEFTEDGVTTTLTCSGGAWQALTIDPIGCSTDTTYRVKGPPFTVATSTDEEEPGEPPPGDYIYGGRIGSKGLPSAACVSSVPISFFIP